MTPHTHALVPTGNEARLRSMTAPSLADEMGSRDQNEEFVPPLIGAGLGRTDGVARRTNCSFPLTPIERRDSDRLGPAGCRWARSEGWWTDGGANA